MVGKTCQYIYIYIYLLSIKKFLWQVRPSHTSGAATELFALCCIRLLMPSTQSKHPYPSSNMVESQQHYCSIARHTPEESSGQLLHPLAYIIQIEVRELGTSRWYIYIYIYIYIRVSLISSINVLYGWIINVSFCKANVSLGLSLDSFSTYSFFSYYSLSNLYHS